MTITDHVANIQKTLKAMEMAQKKANVATRKHHAALQAALEEHGSAIGLTPSEITTYGGGTPKHV